MENNNEADRLKFEEWLQKDCNHPTPYRNKRDGVYWSPAAQFRWQGYQIALAHERSKTAALEGVAITGFRAIQGHVRDFLNGENDAGGALNCIQLEAEGALIALQSVAPAQQPTPFQSRVAPWMQECFGPEISADTVERNHRFLEEALELVQACGATRDECLLLVDYVYGRPVGEPVQEAGGVMVTLAALCLAQGLNMHQAGETELARIWTKVEQIRAKQAAKPRNSPLPESVPAKPSQTDHEGRPMTYWGGLSDKPQEASHSQDTTAQTAKDIIENLLVYALGTEPESQQEALELEAAIREAELFIDRNSGTEGTTSNEALEGQAVSGQINTAILGDSLQGEGNPFGVMERPYRIVNRFPNGAPTVKFEDDLGRHTGFGRAVELQWEAPYSEDIKRGAQYINKLKMPDGSYYFSAGVYSNEELKWNTGREVVAAAYLAVSPHEAGVNKLAWQIAGQFTAACNAGQTLPPAASDGEAVIRHYYGMRVEAFRSIHEQELVPSPLRPEFRIGPKPQPKA